MRQLTPLAIALVLIPLAHITRVSASDHFLAEQSYEDIYYLPQEESLPLLSLGYREALADLIWMKAQVYIGDEFVARGDVANVFNYADAVLELDPDFVRAYQWIGTTGIYRPRDSTNEEARRAIDYLRRGHERFPDNAELTWEYGAGLMYDLAPRFTGAAAAEIRSQAAEVMRIAALQGEGPDWIALTNASAFERLGQTEQAIRHLEEMYPVADPETQEAIAARIAHLRGEARAEGFQRVFRELERSRREHFPFLSPTDFLLVGTPRDLNGERMRDYSHDESSPE